MMFNAVGSRAALESYIHMEEHEVHRWLCRTIDEPDRVYHYLRKCVSRLFLHCVE